MDLIPKIRELRLSRGYTRNRLAAMLDIPYSTLTKYENGTRTPPLSTLASVADLFGVTVDSLLGREAPRKEELEAAHLKTRVCDRINLARISAGLTQADVAAALGMTPQGISNYERGLNRIPGDVLCGMAPLFGVSVEYLLTGHTPAQQWISTIDRLPEPGKKVIVCRDTGYVTMDIYIGYWHKLGPYPTIETTHWMPLPEVPE